MPLKPAGLLYIVLKCQTIDDKETAGISFRLNLSVYQRCLIARQKLGLERRVIWISSRVSTRMYV